MLMAFSGQLRPEASWLCAPGPQPEAWFDLQHSLPKWQCPLTVQQLCLYGIVQKATKVSDNYNDGLSLANINIAAANDSQQSGLSGHHGGKPCNTRGTKMMYGEGGVVYITNLGESTRDGIWSGDFEMRLH